MGTRSLPIIYEHSSNMEKLLLAIAGKQVTLPVINDKSSNIERILKYIIDNGGISSGGSGGGSNNGSAGGSTGDSGSGIDMSVLQPLLDAKVDKVDGLGLSEFDFNQDYKDKLDVIDLNLQHEHGDLELLDGFSTDVNGKLCYEGREVEIDVQSIQNDINSKATIDDTQTIDTKCWSSKKIMQEIATRSPLGHVHVDNDITNLYTNIYKKSEVDGLVNALSMGFTWKEPVETYQDLLLLTPMTSETRIVGGSDIYFYDGTQWTNLGSSSLPPIATDTVDGLLSKEDKKKLDSIESNAPKIVCSQNAPTNPVNGMIWVVS